MIPATTTKARTTLLTSPKLLEPFIPKKGTPKPFIWLPFSKRNSHHLSAIRAAHATIPNELPTPT